MFQAAVGNDATLLSEGMSTMIDGGDATLVQHRGMDMHLYALE